MQTKQPALVILTPGFAKDEDDLTCLPAQQAFILEIKRSFPGKNIIILSFQYPYHSNEYSWHGIRVIPFNGRNKGGLRKWLLFKRINKTLRSIHKENGISGILSLWYFECGFIGKRLADRYGIRHCCWLWGGDAKKENKFPRKLRPAPEELVALSDFLQDEFEKNHGVRPAHVIPPGIDSTLFPGLPMQRDIDIIGVGSFIPLKRYDLFINIVDEIKKHIPEIKAVLIGYGPEEKRLRELISSLGLGSNITLAIGLTYPDVLKHMQRAKIFLHTSSYEGFGAVCIEALCAGAHVISLTRPMYVDIPRWQIAMSNEDMIQKTVSLLKDPSTQYTSVVPYPVDDSVKKMMLLLKQ